MNAETLRARLKDGWTVVGYSCTITGGGAMTHSTLLQKGDRLESVTVIVNGGKELGRNTTYIA